MGEVAGTAYFILNVLGNMALVWKWKSGWPIRIAAILMQGVYAWLQKSPSLTANSIVFLGINCVGWWKWHKAEKSKEGTHEQGSSLKRDAGQG